MNETTVQLLFGLFALLVLATVADQGARRFCKTEAAHGTIKNVNDRIRSWWVLCAIFSVALLTGGIGSLILFGLVSFLALREFITLTPTRLGDHHTLFWVFFVITPLQYVLVGMGLYGLFVILIPVFAFLIVTTRSAIAGDPKRFLERTAEIQMGLVLCVYCVSYAPALLTLHLRGFEGKNLNLLFFLVFVVQISDVMQYLWGKLLGQKKIAPTISPNKTWVGFMGGVTTAALTGGALGWATPFDPLQATLIALLLALAGFAGGLTLSAIKRSRGVKDYGAMIPGHGGILNRIDSLCFAAPIFFHLTRYYFA